MTESATVERLRPPAWRLWLAIGLPLLLIAGVVIIGRQLASTSTDPDAPLAVSAIFQPGSTTAGCTALDAAMPSDLDGHARRPLIAEEPGVAAWGDPPTTLRCGITDPDELTCSSSLTVYNGVSWLTIPGSGSVTYIAVDRSSRVALTVDNSLGVGVVQALSNVVKTVMKERPVCVNGVVNPVDAP